MEPISSLAASAALTLTLGTVTLGVTGQVAVTPKDPSTGDRSVLWRSSEVPMNTGILMSNGQWWTVKTTRKLPNDSITFSLKPPTTSALTTYVVAGEDAHTPIWWVGYPHPSTMPEPEPSVPDDPPVVPVIPGVPEVPQPDPETPPTEG